MSFVEFASPHRLVALLEHHQYAGYAVLFLGALFETLVPLSLAVMGEVFFLAIGYSFAGSLDALSAWLEPSHFVLAATGGVLLVWIGWSWTALRKEVRRQ